MTVRAGFLFLLRTNSTTSPLTPQTCYPSSIIPPLALSAPGPCPPPPSYSKPSCFINSKQNKAELFWTRVQLGWSTFRTWTGLVQEAGENWGREVHPRTGTYHPSVLCWVQVDGSGEEGRVRHRFWSFRGGKGVFHFFGESYREWRLIRVLERSSIRLTELYFVLLRISRHRYPRKLDLPRIPGRLIKLCMDFSSYSKLNLWSARWLGSFARTWFVRGNGLEVLTAPELEIRFLICLTPEGGVSFFT